MFLDKLLLLLQALLFLIFLPFVLLAAFFAQGSRRRLPEEPAPERLPGTDFIVPVEHVDPDEEEMFDRVIGFMVEKMKNTYAAGSGDRVPEVFEDGRAGRCWRPRSLYDAGWKTSPHPGGRGVVRAAVEIGARETSATGR